MANSSSRLLEKSRNFKNLGFWCPVLFLIVTKIIFQDENSFKSAKRERAKKTDLLWITFWGPIPDGASDCARQYRGI